MKFLVDLELDGYTNDEQTKAETLKFIYENLNSSASVVTVEPYVSPKIYKPESIYKLIMEWEKFSDWHDLNLREATILSDLRYIRDYGNVKVEKK